MSQHNHPQIDKMANAGKKHGFRTICQIHEELYKLIVDEITDKDICNRLLVLLREAYSCGISMNYKLTEYKNAKEWKVSVCSINKRKGKDNV